MKRLKVVYIISDINKSLSFEWIALQMDRERFALQFVLLNPGESELASFLKENNIPVQSIPCSGKRDWPKAIVKLNGFLRREKPDAVHCHLLTGSILGLLAARMCGIKQRIYTRHHSDYHFRYFPKGVKWDKLCNALATMIVAPSNAVKEILVSRESVPERKVKVINHGFDLDYFRSVPADTVAAVREKYNPLSQFPVVGVISRFTELKGIQYIIPAFQQLLADYPGALLLLFNAKGDYKQEIETLLQALPQGSYRTIPFENELAAVYRIFEVFVQASTDTHIESFGQTYIEVLAAGTPLVCTLAGIAPDFIIDKKNALVVPFRESEPIYQAMKTILTDDIIRDKIILEGWNSVRDRFSLQQMIRELSSLYVSK